MKNQLFRIVAIITFGLVVYLNVYENDEIGLMPIIASIKMLFFAFIIGIPIIFIRNKISFGRKIGLLVLPLCILMVITLLGFGNVKYAIDGKMLENEVEEIEERYNVDLQKDDVYLTFDNYLLVTKYHEISGITEQQIVVYDSTGAVTNEITVSDLAKAVVPHLPLTEEEMKTTYFDGMYTTIHTFDLLKKMEDSSISLDYRYVTSETPADFEREPDMPEDAKDIQYHYSIIYTPTLDANGDFVFNSATIKVENEHRPAVSYIAEGIESIVAPNTAVLVNEIK